MAFLIDHELQKLLIGHALIPVNDYRPRQHGAGHDRGGRRAQASCLWDAIDTVQSDDGGLDLHGGKGPLHGSDDQVRIVAREIRGSFAFDGNNGSARNYFSGDIIEKV
jgi:hypothetical protein